MQRETHTNGDQETSEETHEEPRPSTSKAQMQSEYDDFIDQNAPGNMSELKLMNSSFKDFQNEEGVSTRSHTRSLEMSSEAHEKAHGFKMLNCYLSVLANQLFAAHVGSQTQNFISTKKTCTEFALLNHCI